MHVISRQRAFLLNKVHHCIRAARQTVSRTAGAQRPISTSLHPNCHRPLTPVFCHRPSFVPSSSLVDHHHTPRRSFHQHQPTQLTPVTRYCHRRDETRHAVSRARRCDCGRCRQWLHCQRQGWVSPGCFLVTSVSPAFLDRSERTPTRSESGTSRDELDLTTTFIASSTTNCICSICIHRKHCSRAAPSTVQRNTLCHITAHGYHAVHLPQPISPWLPEYNDHSTKRSASEHRQDPRLFC